MLTPSRAARLISDSALLKEAVCYGTRGHKKSAFVAESVGTCPGLALCQT